MKMLKILKSKIMKKLISYENEKKFLLCIDRLKVVFGSVIDDCKNFFGKKSNFGMYICGKNMFFSPFFCLIFWVILDDVK